MAEQTSDHNKAPDKSAHKNSHKSPHKSPHKAMDENADKAIVETDHAILDESADKTIEETDHPTVDESTEKTIEDTDHVTDDESADKTIEEIDHETVDESADKNSNESADDAMNETRSGNEEASPIVADEVSEVLTESSVQSETNSGVKGSRFVILALIVILGVVGYYLVSHRNSGVVDLTKIQGNVALSEQELRDVVAADHLTAYWAGPMAGAKYTLLATTPGQIYVKYLPAGVGATDTTTQFRTIGTYVKKSAFAVAQYTGTLPGNVGTINADGNSVFYASNRATNVYIGLKGKDIQIEVYDPVAGQALGLVLIRNQIRQIL